MITLVVFGYLKPADLKYETQKAARSFLNIFQVSIFFLQTTASYDFKDSKALKLYEARRRHLWSPILYRIPPKTLMFRFRI